MILNLKRYISLLLVLMLLIGIVPRAYATEVPTEPVPEETVQETTIAELTEPDLDSTAPTEPTNPPGDAMLTGSDISTYASTQKSILLFDYADNNDYGQCDISGWTDIVAISAGYEIAVGLKSDGTVVAIGYNHDGQCNVSGWTDIKQP